MDGMEQVSEADAIPAVARRTDRERGMALVGQWRSSGQTVTQFCRAQGVPVHRLQYWRRRAEAGTRGALTPTANELLAVELAGPSAENTPAAVRASLDGSVEILVGAVRVQLPLDCGREAFVRILRWTAEALHA
jgi:hypothetical protein